MNARVADIERFAKLYALGCIITRIYYGVENEPAEVHHIVEGKKRLGHQWTIPLSPWFHRGVPPANLRPSEATERLGPSLALNKRAFVERFGTERELLAKVNELIERPEYEF
jgi:hypothetical protein